MGWAQTVATTSSMAGLATMVLIPTMMGGDKLYCGAGRDKYWADKNDYVDSSCETNSGAGPHQTGYTGRDVVSTSSASAPQVLASGGGPSILMPAAALLLGSGIVTYAILRRR